MIVQLMTYKAYGRCVRKKRSVGKYQKLGIISFLLAAVSRPCHSR